MWLLNFNFVMIYKIHNNIKNQLNYVKDSILNAFLKSIINLKKKNNFFCITYNSEKFMSWRIKHN